MGADPLAEELRLLGLAGRPGGSGDTDHSEDAIVTSVMTRLEVDSGHPHEWRGAWVRAVETLGRRRRQVLVALAVVVISLLGAPAVRATVADWFGFDGVRVQIRPSPGRVGTPSPPPTAASGLSLRMAAVLVAFTPMVPGELGAPDGVEVSADRRVLSMSWDDAPGGTVRLDEFDGTLDYAFAKSAPGAEWLMVDGASALWFEEPHEVSVLDAAGRPRVESPRLAGRTLIWETGRTVLRLEGDLSRQQAVEIARSAEPPA